MQIISDNLHNITIIFSNLSSDENIDILLNITCRMTIIDKLL